MPKYFSPFPRDKAHMRRYWWAIILVLILCIPFSGCLQSGKTSTVSAVPTSSVSHRYSIGDIVRKDPGSSMGRVILDYDPAKGYEWRTIVYDKYNRVFYYENEKGTTNATSFENEYPYKTGFIDNPYELPSLKAEYKPAYKTGDVVTEENKPLEGIIILDYDYTIDTYSYSYAYKQSGKWTYNAQDAFRQDRITIEGRYTKRVTTLKL
jgi:hypothetical protein